MHTVCFFPSPPRECRAVTCRVADVLACPHSKPLNVSSRFDYDSSLPITCASGYSTTKKGKATCQANKTALTICPDCQPTPCNTSKFQSPANAYTTQSGIVEVSKHLLIHCVKGYKPSAINMTSSAECLFGPNWQAINTTCDLIRCDPPPQAPANSNITVSGFMYGSTAAYSCAKHYIYVDGDTTLQCDAVGYQGVWKGTPISCKGQESSSFGPAELSGVAVGSLCGGFLIAVLLCCLRQRRSKTASTFSPLCMRQTAATCTADNSKGNNNTVETGNQDHRVMATDVNRTSLEGTITTGDAHTEHDLCETEFQLTECDAYGIVAANPIASDAIRLRSEAYEVVELTAQPRYEFVQL
eukprot:scpid32417/ scgid1979/ 